MAILINTGPPGNGKSKYEQGATIEELIFGNRDIVTSTPCRILPWATADGRGMIGLRHFLQMRYSRQFDVETMGEVITIQPGVLAWGKLLVVEDENELATLFLWRRDKHTGDWFKIRWDDQGEQFNADDLARGCGSCLIITDEAWKCYSSRRWKDTAKATEFYGRQHRKLGDDWHIVTHSCKDIDVQLNRMAQSWQVCTNYGMRRIGIFKQPELFELKTFYEPPTGPAARCFHSKIIRLDTLIVQTYDTSAGVAVGGGRMADVKRRSKGLHVGWLILGMLLFLFGLWMFPNILGKVAAKFLPRVKPVVPNSQSSSKGETREETLSQGGGETIFFPKVGTQEPKKQNSPRPVPLGNQSTLPAGISEGLTNEVIVTGIVSNGKMVWVTLSDGQEFNTVEGKIEKIEKTRVTIDGVVYNFPNRVSNIQRIQNVKSQGMTKFPEETGQRNSDYSSFAELPLQKRSIVVSGEPHKWVRVISEGLDRVKDGTLQERPSKEIGIYQLNELEKKSLITEPETSGGRVTESELLPQEILTKQNMSSF